MTRGQIAYAYAEMRAIVTAAAEPAPETLRACPECGADLILGRFRRSGLWFWSHVRLGDCVFDSASHAVRFATAPDAIQAEVIFHT